MREYGVKSPLDVDPHLVNVAAFNNRGAWQAQSLIRQA